MRPAPLVLAGMILLGGCLSPHGGDLRQDDFVAMHARLGDRSANGTVDMPAEAAIRSEAWRLLESGRFDTKAAAMRPHQLELGLERASGALVLWTDRPVSFETERFDGPVNVERLMFTLDVEDDFGWLCTAEYCHLIAERHSKEPLAALVEEFLAGDAR